MSIKNFNFCGLPVSSFTKDELEEYIENHLDKKDNKVIYGHSLGIFPRLMLQPETVNYIMDYDLYVSDGYKFHVLGRKMGLPFNYRISLPELTYLTLKIASQKKAKVFLLGAKSKVNEDAIEKIKQNYTGITHCSGRDGYFNQKSEPEIVNEINSFKPDLLFLGMPSPKKESFIHRNRDKLNIGITVLNGGMIDVLAGQAKLTPVKMKRFGLALFYRFLQTPKAKIKQILIYYPLISLYFIPKIYFNYKIRNKSLSLDDFILLRKRLNKY